MSKNYLMAHDIGTTGNKACIYNEDGELLASAYYQYDTFIAEGGHVEQKPDDWYKALCESSKEVIAQAKINPRDIAGISFSGHMMGCVPVDKEGKLARNTAFLWADSRSKKEARDLLSKISYEDFYLKTGGGLEPELYASAKIQWIKNNEPEVFKNTYKFLGTKDYLVLKLTGKFVTDFTDASNTGLMDLEEGKWCQEILEACGIPKEKMPDIFPSSTVVGKVTPEAAKESGLAEGTPVVLGGGDVPCAALGAGAIDDGSSHACIGSALWLAVTGKKPLYDVKNRTFLLCHVRPGYFVSQLAMYSAGIAFQWFKENLCRLETNAAKTAGVSPYDLITLKAEKIPVGADKLFFLPFLRGGGAPYYNLNDRGVFLGLTLSHTIDHMARAVLEGVALNVKSMLDILSSNAEVNEVRLIGGGSRSRLWRTIICDALGIPVKGCRVTQESNSLGAAINAGVGVGLYKGYEAADELVKVRETHSPDPVIHERYKELHGVFREAYDSLVNVFDRISEIG